MNIIRTTSSYICSNLPSRETLEQIPGILRDNPYSTAAKCFGWFTTNLLLWTYPNIYSLSVLRTYEILITRNLIQQAQRRVVTKIPPTFSGNLAQISNYYAHLPLDKQQAIIFVVKATADENGAFSGLDFSSYGMQRFMEKYNVVTLTAGSLAEITTAMRALNRPISHLIIKAHGDPDFIQLGHNSTDIITREFQAEDFPNLKSDAHILLQSCSAGVPGGMAESFANRFPQATIYSSKSLVYLLRNKFYLDSENKPAMFELDDGGNQILTQVSRGKVTKEIDLEKELPILRSLANRILDSSLLSFVWRHEHNK